MKPGRREWGEQVINTCMHRQDVAEVLKIWLTKNGDEDILAWHLEHTGVFTVQSAYKIALEEDQAEMRQTSLSTRLDGGQPLYKEIWSANVPPKVWVFAWRLTQEGLATNNNRSDVP
jgi:hypothetical protein